MPPLLINEKLSDMRLLPNKPAMGKYEAYRYWKRQFGANVQGRIYILIANSEPFHMVLGSFQLIHHGLGIVLK